MIGGELDVYNFNPHSRKGSDATVKNQIMYIDYFNPHSRKGSDNDIVNKVNAVIKISTHTPARGVTQKKDYRFKIGTIFQPTLPQGE